MPEQLNSLEELTEDTSLIALKELFEQEYTYTVNNADIKIILKTLIDDHSEELHRNTFALKYNSPNFASNIFLGKRDDMNLLEYFASIGYLECVKFLIQRGGVDLNPPINSPKDCKQPWGKPPWYLVEIEYKLRLTHIFLSLMLNIPFDNFLINSNS